MNPASLLHVGESLCHQQLWEDALPPAPCLASVCALKAMPALSCLVYWCLWLSSLQTKEMETSLSLWCPQYFSLKWCTSNSQLKESVSMWRKTQHTLSRLSLGWNSGWNPRDAAPSNSRLILTDISTCLLLLRVVPYNFHKAEVVYFWILLQHLGS